MGGGFEIPAAHLYQKMFKLQPGGRTYVRVEHDEYFDPSLILQNEQFKYFRNCQAHFDFQDGFFETSDTILARLIYGACRVNDKNVLETRAIPQFG